MTRAVPARAPGMSARARLTASYIVFLMIAGSLLLAVVWAFLLRYVPDISFAEMDRFVPNRSDLQRVFVPAAAAAMGGLLVFATVGGWFLAGRMLAPLTRITEATRIAATGELGHRIHLEGRADEFRELADSVDTMLARLEAHVGEQQRFAANASHELRTPLAITRTLLAVARNDPDRDIGELIERLDGVNARAIGLTEALLLLARAERGGVAREPVDLSLMLEQAAETLLPLAESRGIVVEVTGSVAPTRGSAELLLQLATNLITNAIVHNLPGAGVGAVWAWTAVGPQSVALVVENTGEPLLPERVARLVEPFQRGAERTRGPGDAEGADRGVGLGLAIVASIVRAHDGLLELSPRQGGGLRVVVHLPLGREEPMRPA